jgi:hypothetical protein
MIITKRDATSLKTQTYRIPHAVTYRSMKRRETEVKVTFRPCVCLYVYNVYTYYCLCVYVLLTGQAFIKELNNSLPQSLKCSKK